jgi:hypothetical protein
MTPIARAARGAEESVALVELVEQGGEHVFVAGDRVGLVQRQPRAWQRGLNGSSGSGRARVRVMMQHGSDSLRERAETLGRSPCWSGRAGLAACPR